MVELNLVKLFLIFLKLLYLLTPTSLLHLIEYLNSKIARGNFCNLQNFMLKYYFHLFIQEYSAQSEFLVLIYFNPLNYLDIEKLYHHSILLFSFIRIWLNCQSFVELFNTNK